MGEKKKYRPAGPCWFSGLLTIIGFCLAFFIVSLKVSIWSIGHEITVHDVEVYEYDGKSSYADFAGVFPRFPQLREASLRGTARTVSADAAHGVGVPQRDDADEGALDARLLARLARHRVREVLSGVGEAARQLPAALVERERRHALLHHEHLAL